MSVAPSVKGWCPGAYRPMMSGDGLVVRVRPRLARLTAQQATGLCTLAQLHGSGFLDLTNRANLQIRGVAPQAHDTVLRALAGLDLLDEDPALESRRNILAAPFWQPGALTERLTIALLDALPDLPPLPPKVGFAVDTEAERLLANDPADFRLERGCEGGLILRADGAERGRPVSESGAIPALIEMAQWFAARMDDDHRRMHKLVAHQALPPEWQSVAPAPAAAQAVPAPRSDGLLLGAPFGQIDAAALYHAINRSGAQALRVTPWRLFLLEGAAPLPTPFIDQPGDALLTTDACPGAPFCPSASVETRDLATALARKLGGDLHVSGCEKGCARARPAALTVIGRAGRFDLVKDGHAWDEPSRTGLTAQDLLTGEL